MEETVLSQVCANRTLEFHRQHLDFVQNRVHDCDPNSPVKIPPELIGIEALHLGGGAGLFPLARKHGL